MKIYHQKKERRTVRMNIPYKPTAIHITHNMLQLKKAWSKDAT